jgi:hypothetical protein
MQCINVEFNIPDNAPLVVYYVALVGNWLIMGLKTNSSLVDARLSKMEVAIENIASLAAAGKLAVNQLMERETTAVITTKATFTEKMEREMAAAITTKTTFTEKPKWTTVMAKNVRQVVSSTMETLIDAPKQKEHKLNLRLTGFEAKEGETKKKLVQRLNIELL